VKLRNRLFCLSAAQLVILGLLLAIATMHFRTRVLPVLAEHLYGKAATAAMALGSRLEVPLGARDPVLIERAVADLLRDPDFRYVEVLDARGRTLVATGRRPDGALNLGAARTTSAVGDTVRAWAPVRAGEIDLGRVAVVLDSARLDRARAWNQRLALIALVLWCAAMVYAFRFSRAFVTPIRHMMEFSRKVASGIFDDALSCGGTGELKELEDYLNAMTRELARREGEQRAAAARAESMHRELLAVSRMAGMAEVASGVLHNVGNVLTSLNVSIAEVGDRIRGSRVEALARGVELFSREPGGLPGFLATERGQLFPEYLHTLSRHLLEENASMLAEMASVVRDVEHIKTIVAMQQSYALVTAHREDVEMAALLDDALGMAEGTFARHAIELVKDYGEVPVLFTDRHKLLQIVVSLVSNARHAIVDRADGGGRLTVRLSRRGDRVAIEVEDTGIGIPAENLDRIFQHGFTTKPNGHGFGLHSAANFAAELGGKLVASSDGPGLGATFTVELPVVAPDRAAGDLPN